MKHRVRLMGFAAGLVLAASAGGLALAQTAPQQTSLVAPRMGPWGFDLAGRDAATPVGQDFYRHAVGAYLDKLTIPADRTRWGTFDALAELSDARSRAIIERAAANAKASPEAAKIGTLYGSFMDEATVEARGAKPLAADLAAIRAADTKAKMATLMGKSSATFFSSFFAAYISDDQMTPGRHAAFLTQAGLGMPVRDYYLEANFAAQKQSYRDYVAATLKAIGWADPERNADAIVAMETEIARVSWTRAEQRDDVKMYNPRSPEELDKLAPGFPWKDFIAAEGLAGQKRLIVGEVTAFPKIAAIYNGAAMNVLQAWQAFQVTDSASAYLSKDFADRRFNFRGKTLSGQQEQQPRWKRAVGATGGNLGEAVGKLYVAEYFTPQAKAEMQTLVENLRTALKGRIERLDWMSPATKAEALNKLARMNVKIAYPDKWRDYSAYVVRQNDLFGNIERGVAFEWAHSLDELNKPVDRDEWEMTPQTVNAYFNPAKNEIVFPAGILQPPFFDPQADPAVNYGGIGGVIGHEITHGFDDQGRQSDATGQLRDWWTAEDAARFEVQAKKLGAQYAAYEPLPGMHINPDLTMGENIADMGGVLIAYDAYKLSLGGKEAPVIDGLTGDQRFFLAFAQVWRGKMRDEALKQRLVTDPHSPNTYRANGAVRNSDAFFEAFGIKAGETMYLAPADRVRIW